MKKTIIAVLILVPATLMTGCATQRSSYSYGYNTDYFYKRSSNSHGNSGVVSYGLDFGKGYGLNYGPGDYGNGDYANCNYGNCDYAHDYGNTIYNYNLAYGSGENKSLDYNGYHNVGQTYTRTWQTKSVTWRHVGVDRWNVGATRWNNGVDGWRNGVRWNKSITIYNR